MGDTPETAPGAENWGEFGVRSFESLSSVGVLTRRDYLDPPKSIALLMFRDFNSFIPSSATGQSLVYKRTIAAFGCQGYTGKNGEKTPCLYHCRINQNPQAKDGHRVLFISFPGTGSCKGP